jgi:hypothetical protein
MIDRTRLLDPTVDRIIEMGRLLYGEFFRADPWKSHAKAAAKKWFNANLSTDLLEWHRTWDEVLPMLHRTPSGKFMAAYDELAE